MRKFRHPNGKIYSCSGGGRSFRLGLHPTLQLFCNSNEYSTGVPYRHVLCEHKQRFGGEHAKDEVVWIGFCLLKQLTSTKRG